MALFLSLSLCIHILFHALSAEALCYFPDGTTVANQDTPCKAEGVSACCGQGFACLSNGICEVTPYVQNYNPNNQRFVRGACTDKDWGFGCPSFCVSQTNGDHIQGGTGLLDCPGTTDNYVCANSASFDALSAYTDQTAGLEAICSNHDYQVVFQGQPSTLTVIGVASSTSTSSSSSIASASTTSSTATSTEAAPSSLSPSTDAGSIAPIRSNQSSGANLATAVGAGVGVPLGIIAICIASYFIWKQKRARQMDQQQGLQTTEPYRENIQPKQDPYASYNYTPQYPSSQPAELAWQPQAPHELPTHVQR